MSKPVGLDNGLTHCGDLDFTRYLRRSFARSSLYRTAVLQAEGSCDFDFLTKDGGRA